MNGGEGFRQRVGKNLGEDITATQETMRKCPDACAGRERIGARSRGWRGGYWRSLGGRAAVLSRAQLSASFATRAERDFLFWSWELSGARPVRRMWLRSGR